jgi:hypothetical protein
MDLHTMLEVAGIKDMNEKLSKFQLKFGNRQERLEEKFEKK